MNGPQWTWEFLGADDAVRHQPVSPAFASRFDAESWLGERWRELADQGVGAARLLHRARPVAPALPLRKG